MEGGPGPTINAADANGDITVDDTIFGDSKTEESTVFTALISNTCALIELTEQNAYFKIR